MPNPIHDGLKKLEEKVNALEARAGTAKGVTESFTLRITEQLKELEKRVTAHEVGKE
jgi:hypothetical protein